MSTDRQSFPGIDYLVVNFTASRAARRDVSYNFLPFLPVAHFVVFQRPDLMRKSGALATQQQSHTCC